MFNITFQQIETFLIIAKYLNLSKARDVLFTSQPALSKTLKRFEESVGMRLFTRSNQGLALTSDGEYLYSFLEPLYRTIDKHIQLAQYNATTPVRVLRIVEPSTYDNAEDFNPLKEIVKAYESKYPDVKIQESLCDLKELRQALEFGNADIVFTEDFGIRDIPNISTKHIAFLGVYIAISCNHPLAHSDTLDFNTLSGETLFTIPTLDDKQADLENQLSVCRQIGFTPKRIEFLQNFQTLLHAINLGKGISIGVKLRNLRTVDDIKYYPVKLQITPAVVVAWQTGKLSRESKNFINMLPDTWQKGYYEILSDVVLGETADRTPKEYSTLVGNK